MDEMIRSSIKTKFTSYPCRRTLRQVSKRYCTKECIEEDQFNYNPLNIQTLSPNLQGQVFHNFPEEKVLPHILKKVKEHLKSHGLWDKACTTLPDVDLQLPKFYGTNIDEHIYEISRKQSEPYTKQAARLVSATIPAPPNKWVYKAGWTKYDEHGNGIPVEYPDDEALIFDVEILVPEGNFPTLATAASPTHWYSWCSERLLKDTFKWQKQPSLSDMICMESKIKRDNKPKLIIGHNVGFDRSFIKEQYLIDRSRTRFLDTMSLHIAISGQTSYQRILYVARKSGSKRKEMRELQEQSIFRGPPSFEWTKVSSLNNLNDVYQLHCKGQPLKKETRNIFVTGTMTDIRTQFQELMNYCASDVQATHKVFQKIWPVFQGRFPHPTTTAGMLEMGLTYLPVNQNWQRYIAHSQSVYDELTWELKQTLMKLANEACQLLHDEKYKEDPWLWDLDWSVRDLKPKAVKPKKKGKGDEKEETADERVQQIYDIATASMPKRQPHMPGYPKWYAELCAKETDEDWEPGPSKISTLKRVVPKLLRLTWEGYPLHFDTALGWGYIVPGKLELDEATEETELEAGGEGDQPLYPIRVVETLCEKTMLAAKENSLADSHLREDQLDKLYSKVDESGLDPAERRKLWAEIKQREKNVKIIKRKEKKKLSSDDSPFWHKGDGPYPIKLPGCWFFKLPHKDGPGNRVGNPLSKDFMNKVEEGVLKAMAGTKAEKVLRLSNMCSYWKNNEERISSQLVVELDKKDMPKHVIKDEEYDKDDFHGAIVPRVVTAGTVTRRAVESTWMTASNAYKDRIGSELKAMVQAPPGYHFVGADVDSQELWIAGIIGDAHFAGLHGSTAFGWMTLQGKKSDGTDLHSKTANLVGITRDQAKIFNYGRIYGAGLTFVERLLMQFNHRLTLDDAKKKAKTMYAATKGRRVRRRLVEGEDEETENIGKWEGGSESHMFNKLEEIARASEPRTPVLGCRISQALEPHRVKDNFITSRVNWVVQSSAVDYLHLMLTCMSWLMEEFEIDGRFSISIHDEVRYLVKSEDKYRAALALQITNLLTRSMFALKLGMKDLPQSVAFFSAVDIDKCLRKEVNMDCVTPSNPSGLNRGYGIPEGEALSIYDIIAKTRGQLQSKSVKG